MTEQQIIEAMATKVMGWEPESDFVYRDGVLNARCALGYFKEWNPLDEITDAFQVVEKFSHYKMQTCANGKRYCEFLHEGRLYGGHGDYLQEAICNAALNAMT